MNEIRYFAALSETLNFTRAAEACSVSQPALTRAIQKMEEELGGLLFSREKNNTHLTELGRLIAPQLREVISRTGCVQKLATQFIRLQQADLSVGVLCTIGPMRLVRFLVDLKESHPGIGLALLEATPDRLRAMLLDGTIDIALMSDPCGFDASLHATRIYDERFVIACSAGHRFAHQSCVPMAALDGETYLQRINCEFRDVIDDLCADQNVHLVHSYRSEREDWVLTMVAAGLGVCFVPEFSANVPGVVARLVVEPEVRREICLVSVAGRRHSAPVAAFIKAVRCYSWKD